MVGFAEKLNVRESGSALQKALDDMKAKDNTRFLVGNKAVSEGVVKNFDPAEAAKGCWCSMMPTSYVGGDGKTAFGIEDDCHTAVIGPTRAGKTRRVILEQIATCAASGESIVCVDPKGELAMWSHQFLESKGYKVSIIDMRHMGPDAYNPLDRASAAYREIHDRKLTAELKNLNITADSEGLNSELAFKINSVQAEIDDLISVASEEISNVIDTLFPAKKRGGNKFFVEGAQQVLETVLHYVCSSTICPDKHRTIETAVNIIRYYMKPLPVTPESTRTSYFIPLAEDMRGIYALFPAARSAHTIASTLSCGDSHGKYYETFRQELLNSLEPLANSPKLMNALRETTVDISKIANGQAAVFVVLPNESSYTTKRVATLIINQLYKDLTCVADSSPNLKLPMRTHFILEDFGTLAEIPYLPERLSLSAGMGILFTLSIQSLPQIERVYGAAAKTIILENCGCKVMLKVDDTDTAQWLSRRLGKHNEGGWQQERLTPAEIIAWRPDYGAIVSRTGFPPAIVPCKDISDTPFGDVLKPTPLPSATTVSLGVWEPCMWMSKNKNLMLYSNIERLRIEYFEKLRNRVKYRPKDKTVIGEPSCEKSGLQT